MTAHRTTDDLSAFLDEELTDEERALLEEQLDDDAGLRAELEELRGVVDGVRSLGDVRAPDGFLGAVLARVDAGEGLGEDLFPEDGSANEAPMPGVASPPTPSEDNVVRFPWWLRGPAVAAVAAALVVGIGLSLRDPGPSEPPSVAELTTRPAGSPGVPVPTGTVEDAGDAVVALDPEELPTGGVESIRMEPRGADRVAVGGAGTSATPQPPPAASKPHTSGLREAEADAPEGVVAVAAEAFAPEPDAVADASADEDAESDDLMPAAARNSALGMAPASAGADAGDRDALSAVASLRTGRRDAIGALQDAARQRGWALEFVSPAGGPLMLSDHQTEQVVVLKVPSGQEAAAQRVFDQLGTFGFSSTPTSAEGDTSQLRVTVIFQQP